MILIQDKDEILAINLSPVDEGDFGENSDVNQEPQENNLEYFTQSSHYLLSCSEFAKVVNNMTLSPLVPARPSRHQIRDRPILTWCLPTKWADHMDQGRGPSVLGDGLEAPQGRENPSFSKH